MPLRPPVTEKDHIHGRTTAPIELLEYGDYQCPFCWRAYPIVKHLEEQLGERLKFAFRNFPLAKVHPHATQAAIASEAAALQGKYWEMHDLLYQHHKQLDPRSLLRHAETLELDLERFTADLASPELAGLVETHFLSGLRSGVNATPTFFINGEKYNDSWEGNNLLEFIWMSGLL